ncbi:MAG: NUDIX domain-containing protein [Anaerolineae bacterium]
MTKKVVIHSEKQDYKRAIFEIVEAQLQHEAPDGSMTDTLTRLSFERGDAVAAIIHNPVDDTLLFTTQFRYPTYHKTQDGWLTEVPAGIIDKDELPVDAMRREMEEETGYAVDTLHHLYTFFLSPGGSSERIFLFYGRIKASDKIGAGGGVVHEDEHITTTYMTVDEALTRLEQRAFTDAKTILGLQWLQMNRANLDIIGKA